LNAGPVKFSFHVEQARRALEDYQGLAILILDGFNAYHTDAFISGALDRNIFPIFLAPHSSDRCQSLGLVIHGNMKKFMPTAQIRYLPSNQSQKIVKMLGAGHQATAPHLIVSAFTAMELIRFMGGEVLVYIRLDHQRATGIRSWAGQDPQLMDVWEGGNRRIRLPTQ
jgi:hypothetical protein